MLRDRGIDTTHFSHRRMPIAEDRLREVVAHATSHAEVMRDLGLAVDDTNHRRVRRAASRLGLDTSHFKRKRWAHPERPALEPVAHRVLIVLPSDAGRTNGSQLHRALAEIGMPYTCETCGNKGEWRDNRRENLRYLCPNCHALTETWCRRKPRDPLVA